MLRTPNVLLPELDVGRRWITADDYYGILQEWRDAFQIEWTALPRKDI
jgi:hypothetical protein